MIVLSVALGLVVGLTAWKIIVGMQGLFERGSLMWQGDPGRLRHPCPGGHRECVGSEAQAAMQLARAMPAVTEGMARQ